MKWFFAFTEDSDYSYRDFIKVAVLSAKKNTTLQPYCLYEGQSNEFTDWLQSQGVEIIQCRSSFYNDLEELSQARQHKHILTVGAGAFLRLELPRIAAEKNWDDKYVLYTDCDVMFLRDPVSVLKTLMPKYFSAAPETFVNKPLHMNSGVMWINIPAMQEQTAKLNEFTRSNFENVIDAAWDQGALRVYFNPLHRLAWKLKIPDSLTYGVLSRIVIKTWKWDDLPLELNWKPYWGENSEAVIIHFHGLKPSQRELLAKGELPDFISRMGTPYWWKCVAEWDNWLKKANS